MSKELDALQLMYTWDLVPLPSGITPISCRWIHRVKTQADGSIEHHKARLVAHGFAQEYAINYKETFAHVAKLTTVRLFFTISAAHHWPLHQLDVTNAFLHRDLF
ncbi:uncharacterized mitochondrial protein AtMg00820-like [Dioscorea cayenensis subsp. rotundata]|uniref:Uncharacterized mitochondrial protein AtMg00820-like n=1 Tax=Dioscorea cayennensis subsp. rotundata TaxID=55577 RepID=A0AB40CP98_DIOCR|nr:uncharacterized mitochondrial protein AtMg00820-like [Dioscorea cayenensis subsp. rotundata]